MSVRRLASGRVHYNYFRDLDPATGRYVESDPIGLRGGNNPYGYVRQDPLRFIDPRGLMSWGPYVECLQARAQGDYMRNCSDVLFASAVASEIAPLQRGCEVAAQGMTCLSTCTGEVLFGTFSGFAKLAYEESALKILEHIAHKSASEFLKRGVPVLNVIHLAVEAYHIGHCTVSCVRN